MHREANRGSFPKATFSARISHKQPYVAPVVLCREGPELVLHRLARYQHHRLNTTTWQWRVRRIKHLLPCERCFSTNFACTFLSPSPFSFSLFFFFSFSF